MNQAYSESRSLQSGMELLFSFFRQFSLLVSTTLLTSAHWAHLAPELEGIEKGREVRDRRFNLICVVAELYP